MSRHQHFRVVELTVTAAIILLALIGHHSLAQADDVAAGQKPNVLFLICDDLNCDLGCYGDPQVKSPHIDGLAARGVKFDKAYCQYPLCGPSRASFMTGMYPDQTKIQRNAMFLRETLPNVVSMSEHFRNAGYHSTRIGKIYHYNVPLHIGTGGHDDPFSWDRTINPEGHDTAIHDKIKTLVPGRFGGTLSWYADDTTDEEQTDGIAATEADEILARYAEEQTPFFLAVGLYRPHTPYVAPEKYFDLYPTDSIQVPEVPAGYYDSLPAPTVKTLRSKKDQRDLEEPLAKEAIQGYQASITFADAQIGRILQSLERHGLKDNTIVVFTSDHGYHMGDHGHWQKLTLFEDATHVPMIIAGPGIAEGQSSASLSEMIDFYPTLCSLAGLESPQFLSGKDLTPTLRDPKEVVRADALSQLKNGYALRTDRYRLVIWGENGEEGRELYDHQSDAHEMHNLVDDPKHSQTLAELMQRITQRIENARKAPRGIKQKSAFR